MNYVISYEVSRKQWECSLHTFAEANFLQSWEWGEFQEALGKNVFRFLVLQSQTKLEINKNSQLDPNSQKVVGVVQLVKEEAKRGVYLTIAGGPIFDWDNLDLFTMVFAEIKKLGISQKVDFIRFRPQVLTSPKRIQQVTNIGAITAQMHLTADLTLQLDLTKTEAELLAEMRKNHRSAIKKSFKLGITVSTTKDPKSVRAFFEQQLDLAQRQGFVPFSYDFLHEQFTAFVKSDSVLLFHAYDADELLASAFVIFYNGEAVYHYGISTDANRKLPGSYACQWAAILEAKKRGMRKYNFWGIAPQEAKEHRFSGVTLFKRGFGGLEVEYLHAHDIPLSKKYWLTAAFEFIRKKFRRL